MDNKKFIRGLKNKDAKALDYLLENYANLIFKIANGVLNDRELSKETVNDVILKVWNNVDSFNKSDDKFSIWVMAIAKYTAIDCLRREKRHYGNENIENIDMAEEESIEDYYINKDSVREVKAVISHMGKIDKEIFLRKFFKEESSKIISEKLGITEKLVNLRIFRGRKKLSEKLNSKGV